MDVQNSVSGIYANPNEIRMGGQEKTASGTLRVLVIFVRYKDDIENTPTWQNYNVLPTWAQTFVDPAIPSNNIFTPKNLSDFFDRSSGGDGAGNLGSFHIIGDVVYVTTLQNQASYSFDYQVFNEVLQTLDNPQGAYNINFKLYDNWQFTRGDTLYNHFYKPGIGDGKADHIFIFNRDESRDGYSAEKTLASVNFTSNDGVTISSYSGSRVFGFKNAYTPNAVNGPAHEYCHYLLGGTQTTGHFDGNNYYPNQTGNQGRINQFALMCAVNSGWMSAYERYRLGWLNYYIVNSSNNNLTLKDTHIKNEAVFMPLRYDLNGVLKEFYLIENYHTQRDYAGANPFLKDQVFGDPITHGLLVFHVEDQNITLPCATKINILCADGKWTWKLLTGASTPYDRSDDLIGRDQPTRFGNYDERHFITITVSPVTYSDYVCLDHHPDYPGSKYNRNDFLGDFADFFREGYNDVLTKFSNPASYLIDRTPKDVGFEIVSYNSSTKEYVLNVQMNSAGVLSLKPSKPQNLKATLLDRWTAQLNWAPNIEPDVMTNGKYKIYRAEDGNDGLPSSWSQIALINAYNNGQPVTSYIDDEIGPSVLPSKVFYKISAVDNTKLESLCSDYDWVSAKVPKIVSDDKIQNIVYSLEPNYPNPFNPSTVINYSVKDAGLVKIKVYNILGSEIVELVNENKQEGYYSVEFNASNMQVEFISILYG